MPTTHAAGPLRDRLGGDLDEVAALERRCRPPLTSSLLWLDAFSATHTHVEPWPIAVRRDGELVGWVALGVERGPVVTVSNLGLGLVDRQSVLAVDDAAATELAREVAAALARLPGPWRFVSEQLPATDVFARALLRHLPGAVEEQGDGCPVADVADETSETIGSRNWRKQVRQAGNRIERAGSTHEVVLVEDPDEIVALLPRLADVHVARDNDMDRVSDLEDDAHRAFWRRVISEMATDGRVRVWLVLVDDELAAYDLAFVDDDVLRLWDGRFVPGYEEFWPGKIILSAVVGHAADHDYRAVDLMRGASTHKLRLTDRVDEHVAVRAWSGPAAAVLDRARADARRRFDELREEHEVLDDLVLAVKRRLLLRR